MTPRPHDRFPVAALIIAAVLGTGIGAAVNALATPDARLVIRTVTHDVPPACSKALGAARAERAHTATAKEHATLAAQRSADLADAVLSLDKDTIDEAARALDAELRLAQTADLAAAEAAAAFDTAAGNCLPERQP